MWKIFKFCCSSKDKDDDPPDRKSRRILPKGPKKSHQKTQDQKILPQQQSTKSQSTLNKTHRTTTNQRIQQNQGDLNLGSNKNLGKDRYEGQELDGVPHGNGSMLYANGDFYRGEWVMNKKEGRGLQIYQEGGLQYQGQWQNDQQHGNGKIIELNGSYYVGEFKQSQKDGHGQFFDGVEKKLYTHQYQNGNLISKKEVSSNRSKEQEFPTLALDKQRFNTDDLINFQTKNPDIKEFDLFFLLKFFNLSRLTKLALVSKDMKQWTIKDVIDFLEGAGLKQYKQIFYKNKIKGKDMMTLNQKQLKEDLGMKMGDRKRLLNYMTFLNQTDTTSEKKLKNKDKDHLKRKNSLKFGSSRSMKRVLDNFQSIPIYEQSIQQEMSVSSQGSNNSTKLKDKQQKNKMDSDQRQRYQSAAYGSKRKSSQCYSLEQKLSPESQRSQRNSILPNNRKDSKQNGDANNGGPFQAIPKKESMNKLQASQKERISDEKDKKIQLEKKESPKSPSSQQSTDSLIELTRKKTQSKQHQNSQIRQLYEFLKEHRSLQFLIKEKDIQKLELIGQGGYGKVYKGKYIGQLIAIKDYMKTKRHRHKQDFMKQLMIISDLKHPNIVLYMGICITADKFILVTEYLDNGSLFDQLHRKHKKFTEFQKIEIVYEIVKGMVYLHNMKNILHRDLKSSNVLIGEDWNVVKLCDFGLAGQKKKQKKHKRVGTYQWMAPQVIRNQEKIDEKADVYSFGVIMWELLTEKIPYQGLSEIQIIGLVGSDEEHHLEYPTQGSQFLMEIMKKCLYRDQVLRPSFIQLQNDFQDHFRQQSKMRAMLQRSPHYQTTRKN